MRNAIRPDLSESRIDEAMKVLKTVALWVACASLAAACAGAPVAQSVPSAPGVPSTSQQLENPAAANVTVVGHVLEPEGLDPTPERLAGLRMPAGFEVSVFARDLINPRIIAVADDGTVYVTRRSVGDVIMLRDGDGDGRADGEPTVVASRPTMHGIAVTGNTVYLAPIGELYRTTIRPDGTFAPLELLIDDLPDLGQHPNPMIVVGPDGMLYMTQGSTCNACSEANPENATMLRVTPDGAYRTIFASGLRNTIGYGFVPGTSEIYGMDHGIDWLGRQRAARGAERHRPGQQVRLAVCVRGWQVQPAGQSAGRNLDGGVGRPERGAGGAVHAALGTDADDVLHGYAVPGRVPRRCIHCDAGLMEPGAALRLRGAPHPLREWPTGRLRALSPKLSGAGRR